MPEDEESTPQEVNLDNYRRSFRTVTPGHQDEHGNLRPELVDEEIANKMSAIPAKIYLEKRFKERNMENNMLGISEERMVDIGVEELLGRFPESRESIINFMRDNKDLSPHADRLFPPKEENSV